MTFAPDEAPAWRIGLDEHRTWAAEQTQRALATTALDAVGAVPALVTLISRAAAGLPRGRAAALAGLRDGFEHLGPTYIKLGQVLSGGAGMVPQSIVDVFGGFRDNVRPEDPEEIRRVLLEDLPGGASRFRHFDPIPMASASIAQVHAAELDDGTPVVVKVQRPDINRRIRRDMRWMAAVARIADRAVRPLRVANLPGVVEYLASTLFEELDFRLEADNMLAVHDAVAQSSMVGGVIVPRPHAELVTRRVLVMERIDSIASDDVAAITAAGVDTLEMVRTAFVCFAEGALVHGVFHGDLHPGNIRVTPEGRFAILDYGIVGRLPASERAAFASMLLSSATGDIRGLLGAIGDLGGFPPGADLDGLAAEIDPRLLPAGELPTLSGVAVALRETLQLMSRHRFRFPQLLVLLSKSLLFLDDVMARYDVELDLLEALTPVLAEIQARADQPPSAAAS